MSVQFRKLTPESTEQWEMTGAVLFDRCDPQTGISFTEEELILGVYGFCGEKTYAIEEGTEVCFPDQSKNILGNRGVGVRGLGSCVLLGESHHLSITKVEVDEGHVYRVSTSIPSRKQAY